MWYCAGSILGIYMTAPHLDFVGATDASTDFGYGASIAPMSPSEIRRLARLDTKVGDHVTLGAGSTDDTKPGRLGEPHRLNCALSDFRTVMCLRVDDKEHINIREGRAFLTYLRWLLRSGARHGKRVVVLVD